MSTPNTRPAVMELRERIQCLEGSAVRHRTVLPFGLPAIDRHLEAGYRWAPCMKWPGVEMARLTVRLPPSSLAASPRGHAEKYCGA